MKHAMQCESTTLAPHPADGFQVMTGGRKWPSVVYNYADVMAANGGTMTFLVDVTGY